MPALGVSVELRLGLPELESVGISTLTRKVELALAGPVGGFDEARDDGLDALWGTAVVMSVCLLSTTKNGDGELTLATIQTAHYKASIATGDQYCYKQYDQ